MILCSVENGGLTAVILPLCSLTLLDNELILGADVVLLLTFLAVLLLSLLPSCC